MLPVFAVYSSFLQRCYDEIIHDLSIEEQHVVIGIDRAGIVGNDGETHQGLFDVAMLSNIPKIIVYSPATYAEMRWALEQSLYAHTGVCCVRYPRGGEVSLPEEFDPHKDWSMIHPGKETVLVTYGRIASEVCKAAQMLAESGTEVSVLKINRILPFCEEVLAQIKDAKQILFVEEGMKNGGIGQILGEKLLEQGYQGRYQLLAIDDCFVSQATVARAIELSGLDAKSIVRFYEQKIKE